MAKLDRNGVKIHYEVHGSGPTILLSHGYSSTSRMWDGQVAALKDRYRVIVWDFRGHGESDYPADQNQYSEALTVGDMKAPVVAPLPTKAPAVNKKPQKNMGTKPSVIHRAWATEGGTAWAHPSEPAARATISAHHHSADIASITMPARKARRCGA